MSKLEIDAVPPFGRLDTYSTSTRFNLARHSTHLIHGAIAGAFSTIVIAKDDVVNVGIE